MAQTLLQPQAKPKVSQSQVKRLNPFLVKRLNTAQRHGKQRQKHQLFRRNKRRKWSPTRCQRRRTSKQHKTYLKKPNRCQRRSLPPGSFWRIIRKPTKINMQPCCKKSKAILSPRSWMNKNQFQFRQRAKMCSKILTWVKKSEKRLGTAKKRIKASNRPRLKTKLSIKKIWNRIYSSKVSKMTKM